MKYELNKQSNKGNLMEREEKVNSKKPKKSSSSASSSSSSPLSTSTSSSNPSNSFPTANQLLSFTSTLKLDQNYTEKYRNTSSPEFKALISSLTDYVSYIPHLWMQQLKR